MSGYGSQKAVQVFIYAKKNTLLLTVLVVKTIHLIKLWNDGHASHCCIRKSVVGWLVYDSLATSSTIEDAAKLVIFNMKGC